MGIATAIAIYFLIWWIVCSRCCPLASPRRTTRPCRAPIPARRAWPACGPEADLDDGRCATVRVRGLRLRLLNGLVTLDDLARLLGVPEFEASKVKKIEQGKALLELA